MVFGGFTGGFAGGASVNIIINAVDNFSKTFSNVSSKLGKIGGGFLKMGAMVAKAGIAVGSVAAIVGGIGIKSFVDFEQQMASVRKTTGMTKDETVALGRELRKMAAGPLVASAEELANVAAVAGQLGIKGSENIKQFSESVIKASVALDISAEEAATSTAKIGAAFNIPIDQSEKFLSSINELSNTTAASAPEIISALTRVASSAAPLGISLQNASAMTTQLIAMGEPAERAGTKLRSAFDQIAQNIPEISELLGITAEEFKDSFGKNPQKMLSEVFKKLKKIKDPLDRNAKASEIFGTVGASAISKLTMNMEELDRLMVISNEGFEKGTSLNEEYSNAVDTTGKKFENVKQKIAELGMVIGEKLLPLITPLVEKFSNFISTALESENIKNIFEAISNIWEFGGNAFERIKEIAKTFVETIDWEMFKKLFTTIWDKIIDNKETIITAFKDVATFAGNIFNAVGKIFNILVKLGLMDLMISAFSSLATILSTVSGWFSKILGYISNIIDKLKGSVFGEKLLEMYSGMVERRTKQEDSITQLFNRNDATEVDDFILTPNGALQTNPNDTIIGTKNPGGVGGTTVYIENVYGTDPDEIAEAIYDNLTKKISY